MIIAVDNFRQSRDTSMKAAVIPAEKAGDVKMGTDVGIFATADGTQPLPDITDNLLVGPLNLRQGKR